jgi:hypothetical protein
MIFSSATAPEHPDQPNLDRVFVFTVGPLQIFGVLDGISSLQASGEFADAVISVLRDELRFNDYVSLFSGQEHNFWEIFLSTIDDVWFEYRAEMAGCTLVLVVLSPGQQKGVMVSAGDSVGAIYRKNALLHRTPIQREPGKNGRLTSCLYYDLDDKDHSGMTPYLPQFYQFSFSEGSLSFICYTDGFVPVGEEYNKGLEEECLSSTSTAEQILEHYRKRFDGGQLTDDTTLLIARTYVVE